MQLICVSASKYFLVLCTILCYKNDKQLLLIKNMGGSIFLLVSVSLFRFCVDWFSSHFDDDYSNIEKISKQVVIFIKNNALTMYGGND